MVTAGHLLIRADASPEIGAGHQMRCLALAQAWRDQGGTAAFAAARQLPAVASRLAEEGFPSHHLQAAPGSREDAAATAALAHGSRARWVAVDGYDLGPAYQRELKKKGLSLLLIDDLGCAGHYWADLVVNPNTSATPEPYRDREPATRVLLGPRYALIRAEFCRAPHARSVPSVATKVLITMGGSDPRNATLLALEALDLLTVEGLEAVAVVGGGNERLVQLERAAARRNTPVRLVTNARDMSDLMAWADLAIASASSTAWELAHLGTPSLVLVTVDNQGPVARTLDDLGVAQSLGPLERLSAPAVAEAVLALAGDHGRRSEMAERGRELIDGQGSRRIARTVAGGDSADVEIRRGTIADVVELLALSNDPTVRSQSFHPKPIAWADHVCWYRDRLSSAHCAVWVAEVGGVVGGQIRYDRTQVSPAEISLSVAPSFRGAGLATRMLSATWRPACEALGADRATGTVRAENLASQRSFERAGFRLVGPRVCHEAPCVTFEKRLLPGGED